jgi:hypothetical protein
VAFDQHSHCSSCTALNTWGTAMPCRQRLYSSASHHEQSTAAVGYDQHSNFSDTLHEGNSHAVQEEPTTARRLRAVSYSCDKQNWNLTSKATAAVAPRWTRAVQPCPCLAGTGNTAVECQGWPYLCWDELQLCVELCDAVGHQQPQQVQPSKHPLLGRSRQQRAAYTNSKTQPERPGHGRHSRADYKWRAMPSNSSLR